MDFLRLLNKAKDKRPQKGYNGKYDEKSGLFSLPLQSGSSNEVPNDSGTHKEAPKVAIEESFILITSTLCHEHALRNPEDGRPSPIDDGSQHEQASDESRI